MTESNMNEERVGKIMEAVRAELIRAMGLHAPHSSLHESWGVLDEEFTELKTEIHDNNWPLAIKEAIQVGAMAVRLIHDEQERREVPIKFGI